MISLCKVYSARKQGLLVAYSSDATPVYSYSLLCWGLSTGCDPFGEIRFEYTTVVDAAPTIAIPHLMPLQTNAAALVYPCWLLVNLRRSHIEGLEQPCRCSEHVR